MQISGLFRYRPLSGFLILFGALFVLGPKGTFAAPGDILISEVSVSGEKSSDEFVELYNTSDSPLDLSGLQLRRRTQSGSESSVKVFTKNSFIPAHGHFLWANSQGLFALPFADSETSSSALADDNSIALFTSSGASGVLIDSIAWGKGSLFSPSTPIFPNLEKKQSLTRTTDTLTWTVTTLLTPTNSRGETWAPPGPDPILPPPITLTAIRFNEIFANPSGNEEEQEFIELLNEADDATDVGGFTLRDASKTGAYTFPLKTILNGHSYLVLKRSTSKLSLNNSNESLSLFSTTGALVDTVAYQKTKEGISLNYTGSGWRGGIPTPGAANQLNTLPETREKVPKKGYRGVPVSFNARGKDADGDTLKYVWDFGDGHKSYKATTTHRYEKNSTYTIVLTVSDGSDDVSETFALKIESFPETKVRITSLVPNPRGLDSEGEFLIIENREKKSVNLKDFSITTGWKKLINHPIRENFIIAAKSEGRLTREFSLFTLPNEKGRVELRGPDGKTLQKIQYKLTTSAKEDAIYRKEKGKRWQWEEVKVSPGAAEKEEVPMDEVFIEPLAPEPLPQEITEGSTITLPERKAPSLLPLLNYGTHVTLPHDIELTFDDSIEEIPLLVTEHYALTFAKEVASEINTVLNALQNK